MSALAKSVIGLCSVLGRHDRVVAMGMTRAVHRRSGHQSINALVNTWRTNIFQRDSTQVMRSVSARCIHRSGPLGTGSGPGGALVPLANHELTVPPGFGTVRLSGQHVDYLVKPASPQEFPDADRAFVRVFGAAGDDASPVTVTLHHDTLSVDHPGHARLYCELHVPIKYDVAASLGGDGSVTIAGMEADEVDVTTVDGDVVTRGLKSHNVRVNTNTGNITAEGTLQGNVFITAKSTHLRAKRLQGLKLNILAEELTTTIASSYMNEGQISAGRGDVTISHLHGTTRLSLGQGRLVLSGVHGQVEAEVGSGQVEMQVTEVTGDSHLTLTHGHLDLAILEQPRHNLTVEAPELEVDEEVVRQGTTTTSTSSTSSCSLSVSGSGATLRARVVSGSARVKQMDWFSTLGIKVAG